MIAFKITDHADQQFSTVIGGRRVTFRVRYNAIADRWSFDLSIDDLPVLHGRRIVTGVDLLEAFDLGVGVIFASVATPGALPNRVSLPNGEVQIYSATEAEVDAAVSS
ncbi:phage baseplate plug family protein [Pararhizobium sp.]|uniref:phage baseplate plug family protein n=1 Tax=Pararhizobium sp. TaxID=1977563 RepID=UPI002726DB9D|nr:hypothetical protein [Pararhizobium sp.]MDO9417040.1 hypothetical protein [Pararhizobium sp.]